MKYFELAIWDGYCNVKRMIYADSYDMAVKMYCSCLPPAYIWSIEPVKE